MEARKTTLGDIFTGNNVSLIPYFQRPYVWGEEYWERLLDDLKDVSESGMPYFMGSLIRKEKIVQDEIFKVNDLVDGQQRMTTLFVFFKVLSLIKDDNLFEKKFISEVRGNVEVALRHSRFDGPAFNWIMNLKKLEDIPDSFKERQITKSYSYIRNELEKNEGRYDIWNIYENLQFVVIDLAAEEDEQQIFDTINSLGVPLTTAELLKNYLFNKDNEEDYQTKWYSIFEMEEDSREYWDKMIDRFLYAYLQIISRESKLKVRSLDRTNYMKIDKLFHSYKHFISTYLDNDHRLLIDGIYEAAKVFKGIFDPEVVDTRISRDDYLARMNLVIYGLHQQTLIPYIFFIELNVKDKMVRENLYKSIETFYIRRVISRATTKNYNNIFQDTLISNGVDSSEKFVSYLKESNMEMPFPSNEDIEESIINKRLNNREAKFVLYFLELELRETFDSTDLFEFSKYQLEHLMPKKWIHNWSDNLPDNVTSEDRDKKLLTMGNLAIISGPLNSSISNSNWRLKLSGDSKRGGLVEYGAGIKTHHEVLGKPFWDENCIEERGNQISKWVKDVWTEI